MKNVEKEEGYLQLIFGDEMSKVWDGQISR